MIKVLGSAYHFSNSSLGDKLEISTLPRIEFETAAYGAVDSVCVIGRYSRNEVYEKKNIKNEKDYSYCITTFTVCLCSHSLNW